jgi:hypothetical protein
MGVRVHHFVLSYHEEARFFVGLNLGKFPFKLYFKSNYFTVVLSFYKHITVCVLKLLFSRTANDKNEIISLKLQENEMRQLLGIHF